MNSTRFDSLRSELGALRIVSPPLPWRSPLSVAVGGLRAVGFDRHPELLLIESSAGRGVIDCADGTKLARDDNEYYEGEELLEAAGIGQLQAATIRMLGLFGGGLPTRTTEGWSVEVLTFDWPVEEVILVEPKSFLCGSLMASRVPSARSGQIRKSGRAGFRILDEAS